MTPHSAFTGLLAQMSESVPDPWADSFLGFGSEQRFALIIVALGCLTGLIITLVCVISSAFSQAHQRRLEIELKREMLDRGMSADEVARVIETTVPDQTTNYLNAMCRSSVRELPRQPIAFGHPCQDAGWMFMFKRLCCLASRRPHSGLLGLRAATSQQSQVSDFKSQISKPFKASTQVNVD